MTTDNTLRRLIDTIEAGEITPRGQGVLVTLFLPWGKAVGEIRPAWYFDQKVAQELRIFDTPETEGLQDLGEELIPKEGQTASHASEEFVVLSGDVLAFVNGQVYEYPVLRLRVADVSAWTVGHGAHRPGHSPS
jgi:hypothetical protein